MDVIDVVTTFARQFSGKGENFACLKGYCEKRPEVKRNWLLKKKSFLWHWKKCWNFFPWHYWQLDKGDLIKAKDSCKAQTKGVIATHRPAFAFLPTSLYFYGLFHPTSRDNSTKDKLIRLLSVWPWSLSLCNALRKKVAPRKSSSLKLALISRRGCVLVHEPAIQRPLPEEPHIFSHCQGQPALSLCASDLSLFSQPLVFGAKA